MQAASIRSALVLFQTISLKQFPFIWMVVRFWYTLLVRVFNQIENIVEESRNSESSFERIRYCWMGRHRNG